MKVAYSSSGAATATPIELVADTDFDVWIEGQSELAKLWCERHNFRAKPGQHTWLPTTGDAPDRVIVGWDSLNNLSTLGGLPLELPEGDYKLLTPVNDVSLVGWGLGSYQFEAYKASQRAPAKLVVDAAELPFLEAATDSVALGRNLINAGADDMRPSHLANAAVELAADYDAECVVTAEDALLEAGYRTIHAVGRAAEDGPRLVDLTWGPVDAPKVTLVGKGVCFDSGGLNLKPANGMRWMKKDMGGAGIALGLAKLIMQTQLPVRLRVLIPAVENAIAGDAYRPGDVIQTYSGKTVEIDNTDAEGRLVMCDALTLACEEDPDLLIDFATLTGSARSAVGAEISAMFCNNDEVAKALHDAGVFCDDAVWRMPLHDAYEHMLKSNVADTVNSAASPYGGSITAALFLKKFVSEAVDWVHFDLMAFNTRSRPGRPEGGEAMALRTVYQYLRSRYVV